MSARRGFLLPLALLGLLAVTALAMSTFVLARGLARDAALERRYLEEWAAPSVADTIDLAQGWELLALRGAGERRGYRVERFVDPALEAVLWTVPVFAPALSSPAGSGIEHEPAAGRFLEHFEALAALLSGGATWRSDAVLPGGPQVFGPAILMVSGVEEDGTVWVLADGDVEIRGEGTARGILLARGSVTIGAGTEWEGGVAAVGWVEVEADADVILDRTAIESTLTVLPEPRRIPLIRGAPLGRF